MSGSTRIKLPSIAELTSHTSSPNVLPLLLIFKAAVPPFGQDYPREHALPPQSHNAPRPHQAFLAYSYSLPPPPPPYPSHITAPPMHSNGPQVAPPPPPGAQVAQSYYLPGLYRPMYFLPAPRPVVGTEMYSVPEVINKPMNECHRCGTTETPEWRRGPNGLRTLCNACGLFHAKLVKRKGAALAAEEVLNNKVCKGKNGRRVSVRKQASEDQQRRSREAQVTEIPPVHYGGVHAAGLIMPFLSYNGHRMLPALHLGYQELPALRN